MKVSEIAAARARVALALSTGSEVPDYVRKAAALPLSAGTRNPKKDSDEPALILVGTKKVQPVEPKPALRTEESAAKSEVKNSATASGRWFDVDKNVGFIAIHEGAVNVLAHYSAISGEGYRLFEKDSKLDYDAPGRFTGASTKSLFDEEN